MDERRLQRGDLPVHVIARRLAGDAHAQLVILVRFGAELPADHSEVHERHQDLPVVHQSRQAYAFSTVGEH